MVGIWMAFIDFHARRDPAFQRSLDAHDRFGEFVMERIDSDDWCVVVAVSEATVVGHAMGTVLQKPPVFIEIEHGYVQDLAVMAGFRREGIGTALYRKMVEWFKSKGVSRIELDTATTNEMSQPFWRKMGYAPHMIRLARRL
jgi:ribosomal protein S18 acetylase RimI-like enzyme